MKKIIIAAIVSGIALAALTARNFSGVFTDGLIAGLIVITILAGSSAIIAVKERRKQAWH
ncbi:hypothetical protein DVB69_04890 [Sporosarcina sp. BI001-red]|uniref:hypothetical protein n=1 Tax=Sporosarcina sp. BI001-red TaxID=2282866 RepID=UPI000E25CABE|nr:hypothetical protein [Sporosarcina sp. BI001-red]REB10144.1 hypothetical protein DVB69_04890 [Sporosarcina sp. BI001-red]